MIHDSHVFNNNKKKKQTNETKLILVNMPVLSAILYVDVILIKSRCCSRCTETTREGSEHGIYNNRNFVQNYFWFSVDVNN
jgi:hypothetical protein